MARYMTPLLVTWGIISHLTFFMEGEKRFFLRDGIPATAFSSSDAETLFPTGPSVSPSTTPPEPYSRWSRRPPARHLLSTGSAFPPQEPQRCWLQFPRFVKEKERRKRVSHGV